MDNFADCNMHLSHAFCVGRTASHWKYRLSCALVSKVMITHSLSAPLTTAVGSSFGVFKSVCPWLLQSTVRVLTAAVDHKWRIFSFVIVGHCHSVSRSPLLKILRQCYPLLLFVSNTLFMVH